MRKFLKWVGIGIAVLVGLVLLLLAYVYIASELRMNRDYAIQVESLAVPNDAASIEHGRHIATIRACIDCHGEDLGGKVLLEDPLIGTIHTANLTSGQGGIGSRYSDEDYVRALRHGVDPEGKPLVVMPANEFYYLSDQDLGAVIAYVKSVPAVDREWPERQQIAMPARALTLAGQLQPFPAELIDHSGPRPVSPEPGVTVEYGGYLAITCTGCHGEGLSGGPIPGTPPDWPEPLNLTPGGELVGWSEADFIQALRSGVTPGGRELDNEYMPWKILGTMTDDELKAVWLYLQSIPANEQGNR